MTQLRVSDYTSFGRVSRITVNLYYLFAKVYPFTGNSEVQKYTEFLSQRDFFLCTFLQHNYVQVSLRSRRTEIKKWKQR